MAQIHPTVKTSFDERANSASHPLTSYLLRLMDLKASNLCLSADVSTARELLALADRIGPSIVVFKTHHDVVSGWDHTPNTGTGARLAALARRHGFLIFEDRKFGDIGNTVQLQYTGGVARIIEWAHIVNVNMVPGPATVTSLAAAAARWTERYPYEVKTLVSAGTPKADGSDDDDNNTTPSATTTTTPTAYADADADADAVADADETAAAAAAAAAESERRGSSDSSKNLSVRGGDGDPSHASIYFAQNEGRKGSIVSITTVTQSYEPASSPRGSAIPEGDEPAFAGIGDAPMQRGLLILAQMSSEGNFMTADYTKACVEVARQNSHFVMGFVSQQSLNSEPDDAFIHMTPGCQLPPEGNANGYVAGDGKGQTYNTPKKLVEDAGVDIVIVGRGILNAGDPQKEAERYRREAWRAYLSRCHDTDAQ